MSGFVLAHNAWNSISNHELGLPYKAIQSGLVLRSATTISNICWRTCALTVDAIKKQLLLQNKVSLALDGCSSTNKRAITSVIAYYIDRNRDLSEVQLAFDEVDRLFLSAFES